MYAIKGGSDTTTKQHGNRLIFRNRIVISNFAEQAEALTYEGEKALSDFGEEQLEPPAPFDMGGERSKFISGVL